MNWRSFWIYLWHEKLGYHRPSPITAEDQRQRDAISKRLDRLASAIAEVDAAKNVYHTPPPSRH